MPEKKAKGKRVAVKKSGTSEPPMAKVNKLVLTTKNPTKNTKKLCSQLRKIFSPDGLTNLKDKNPKVADFLGIADHFLLSHILHVTDAVVQMGVRPRGPTYTFRIVEYTDNFKNFSQEYYNKPPFITFQGESELRQAFEGLGKNEPGFKRALHINFEGPRVTLRHYGLRENDTEDNFVLGLKEIGPRLTLELVKTEDGLFPSIKRERQRPPKRKVQKEVIELESD